MAKSNAVWGIDIGQCSLKALRGTISEDGEGLTALAYDYIEYPKILSQPDADPVALIDEALQLFLSRNEIRGDRIAVSLPGQNGLARFIKLPPVESKKLTAIVSYEARQQIPFPLDEVVWDYQKMPGGSEEEGFSLETEVGLFAMKRDQVFRAIRPFENVGLELDVVQLSPLTIYNFVVYDQMSDLVLPEKYDPDNLPESLVIISMGTDATDLVVTNGYRVWQRSVPLGGTHFTKQLSKELKLTFTKAEHLKRNAHEAQDPKQVFKAMRPVFRDFVTEIQRSIGFFQSIDRDANIGRVLALGNALKLPGLMQYLEKSLGYPVSRFEAPRRLQGTNVLSTPVFEENLLTFPVCYGLVTQGLRQSAISTNLLPREIITRRLVKQKKPWAVFAVAVLMAGLLCHYFFTWSAWSKVQNDRFGTVLVSAKNVTNTSSNYESQDKTRIETYEQLKLLGEAIVQDDEGRRVLPELLRAIYLALPHDPDMPADQISEKPLEKRSNLYVEKIESTFYSDLSKWWHPELAKYYEEGLVAQEEQEIEETEELEEGEQPAQTNSTGSGTNNQKEKILGPKDAGWVVQISGYHFYNLDPSNRGEQYVRNTLVQKLQTGSIELPDGPNGEVIRANLSELGIQFPFLIPSGGIEKRYELPNPAFNLEKDRQDREKVERGELELDELIPESIFVRRCTFLVQFCWQETPASKRLELRREREKTEDDKTSAGSEVARRF